MYVVVSKWQMKPGQAEAFKAGPGREMRNWLRAQPEVEFVYEFLTADGDGIAIVAYTDEPSYRKLILAENSAFEQKAREMNLDELGTWMWSERGQVEADEPALR